MNYVIKPLDETGHSRSSLKKLKFNSKYPELDDYITTILNNTLG